MLQRLTDDVRFFAGQQNDSSERELINVTDEDVAQFAARPSHAKAALTHVKQLREALSKQRDKDRQYERMAIEHVGKLANGGIADATKKGAAARKDWLLRRLKQYSGHEARIDYELLVRLLASRQPDANVAGLNPLLTPKELELVL